MKQTLPEQIYPWHQNVWETLTTRFPNIGHGLLFYGKKVVVKRLLLSSFLLGSYVLSGSQIIWPVGSVEVVSG